MVQFPYICHCICAVGVVLPRDPHGPPWLRLIFVPTDSAEVIRTLTTAFAPIRQAVRRAQAVMAPFARQIIEAERGAPLGRKRRARRARGRRRHA